MDKGNAGVVSRVEQTGTARTGTARTVTGQARRFTALMRAAETSKTIADS